MFYVGPEFIEVLLSLTINRPIADKQKGTHSSPPRPRQYSPIRADSIAASSKYAITIHWILKWVPTHQEEQ